ncbi:hypothetical protein DDY07_12830 [Methylomonas sp. ZR1]|nr:hypothetical protein [Methylomonas sp. ZR1]
MAYLDWQRGVVKQTLNQLITPRQKWLGSCSRILTVDTMCHFLFESAEDFMAAFMSHAAELNRFRTGDAAQ